MDQNMIKCMCGKEFIENDFVKHFGGCQPFKAEFKDFDSKFGELLKAYSEPKEKLLIVRYLLKLYIVVIEKKLVKYYSNINNNNNHMMNPPAPAPAPAVMRQEPQPRFNNPPQYQNNPPPQQQMSQPPRVENPWKNSQNKNDNPVPMDINEDRIKKNPSNEFDGDFEPQPMQKEDDNSMACQCCKRESNTFYLECVHSICYDCFEREARNNFFDMKCKICNKEISYGIKKDALKDKYDIIENEAVMKAAGGNFLKCPYPGCGEQIEFEPGR